MSEFTLRPARLREGKFVPDRSAEPTKVDWSGLVKRFAPARTQKGVYILRTVRPGMFVGLRQSGKRQWNFIYDSAGRSRNVPKMLRKDPTFAPSVVDLVYVEKVQWDMQLKELGKV